MKKLLLLKSLLLLCALVVGSGSVWATDITTADFTMPTPQFSENFNSLSATSGTGNTSSATNLTSQTAFGIFDKIYCGKAKNTWAIENNTTFDSNVLSLSAVSGSPVIASITGKTFGTTGAFSIKMLKTDKSMVGLYSANDNNAYTKANASVYIQNTAGALSIGDGTAWVSIGTYTSDVIEVLVVYNNTNSSTSYGDGITLASKKAHIYVNGTCKMDGANPQAFTIPGANLTVFRVLPQAANGNKCTIDDLKIYNSLPTASGGGGSNPSSNVSFTNTTPSINYPATSSYSQAATTADGYDGAITYSITANTAGATINASTGLVTVTGGGSVTVKASAAATASFSASEATYTLTVNDTRTDSELAFGEASVTKTWGESFTGQELTNPNSLPVTWSSTEETVATVNASGVVNVLKAGTTTIKATFAGDATYKNDIVSYTLTINKAPAGLSYTTTSFNIKLNDASFVAPTLNNPNGLTVTYASNNETVALVDENTGVLAYVETTAGTAKITASFAGNDNYYPGSANYTINIVDPTVKGCVFNPYTVAEVIGQATATTFGNDIYVTGYIVGNYNATAPVNPATGDTNFALADASSETDGSKTIPVELKNNTTWRTNWGPQSNNVIGYKVLLKGNAESYFSTKGIKGVSEITAVSVPVTPGHAKITYVTPQKMDFSEVSGLKAYVATDAASSGVTMTRVEAAVPENTPLLLIGTASTTYNVPVAASATAPATNYLVKGDGTTEFDGTTYDYILYSDGKFYQIGNGTVATNKAYLHLDAAPSGARSLDIVFDDNETTGVNEVKTQKATGEYFNLAGQRVAQPTKGLYIVNGKKVIIK